MNFDRLTKGLFLLAAALALFSPCAKADADASSVTARTSPEWLRSGTIYEIYPRDFSAAGNLNGVTAKLDELHSLGVNILWTMPIHPIGEKFRKGGFGCDVAYMGPTDFWEQVRDELTKVKPDIMMLAEASKPELLTKAFDIDYSWPLLATLNKVLIHDAPASDILSLIHI